MAHFLALWYFRDCQRQRSRRTGKLIRWDFFPLRICSFPFAIFFCHPFFSVGANFVKRSASFSVLFTCQFASTLRAHVVSMFICDRMTNTNQLFFSPNFLGEPFEWSGKMVMLLIVVFHPFLWSQSMRKKKQRQKIPLIPQTPRNRIVFLCLKAQS